MVSLSTHAVVTTISTMPAVETGLASCSPSASPRTATRSSPSSVAWASRATSWRPSTRRPSRSPRRSTSRPALTPWASWSATARSTTSGSPTRRTGADAIQNLNLAVSDPASQPYVTSVGGTSLGHGAPRFGPPPTETVWNDQLYYSEGAGGGGISQTFAMPDYQQALGTVSGSSGTPCANSGGDCREVPDVSADADPSTRLHRLRHRQRARWLERAGRDERRHAAVGRRPGGRRLGRRQHRRLRRAEPGALPPGPAVPGHLPQRRHVGGQRLQRHRRRSVSRHGRATTWPPAWARPWRRSWRRGSPPSR